MGREVRRVPATWEHPKGANGRHMPLGADAMPPWPEAERTHWQMYENTSAGTPLSPPCETPEALAKWLADHYADAGAGTTGTAEEWLAMIKGRGYSGSAMFDGRKPISPLSQ